MGPVARFVEESVAGLPRTFWILWAGNLGFAFSVTVAGMVAASGYSALFIGDAVTTFVFLIFAALFVGIGFGMTGLADTAPAHALAIATWTMGEILIAPLNAAMVADMSPPSLRGRYQGAFFLSWSVAALAGPALGSTVLGTLGPAWLWTGCFAIGALASVGHLLLGARRDFRPAA